MGGSQTSNAAYDYRTKESLALISFIFHHMNITHLQIDFANTFDTFSVLFQTPTLLF